MGWLDLEAYVDHHNEKYPDIMKKKSYGIRSLYLSMAKCLFTT